MTVFLDAAFSSETRIKMDERNYSRLFCAEIDQIKQKACKSHACIACFIFALQYRESMRNFAAKQYLMGCLINVLEYSCLGDVAVFTVNYCNVNSQTRER